MVVALTQVALLFAESEREARRAVPCGCASIRGAGEVMSPAGPGFRGAPCCHLSLALQPLARARYVHRSASAARIYLSIYLSLEDPLATLPLPRANARMAMRNRAMAIGAMRRGTVAMHPVPKGRPCTVAASARGFFFLPACARHLVSAWIPGWRPGP